jgi:nucleotide-binding universal stress UspA family protein
MFRRILVPLDGSAEAEAVLGHVANFAATEATVCLLHVLPSGAEAALGEQRRSYLARIAPGPPVGKVQRVLSDGDVVDRIIRAAVIELRADLVAMSTQDRRGLRHRLANRVSRGCRLPVLLVRSDMCTRPIRRILVHAEGSNITADLLETAKTLAWGTSAELILLQVIPRVFTMLGPMGPSMIPYPLPESNTSIQPLVNELQREGLRVRGYVESGNPASHIAAQAKTLDVDVILIATPVETALEHALFGSVAESIFRTVNRPIILKDCDRGRS